MHARESQLHDMLRAIKADPNPYDRFASSVLGRPHWSRQRQVCRSVKDVRTTVVPAGNAVGKSYVGADIVLGFQYLHPGSLVFTSAPTQAQLEAVLWKEIGRAHGNARLELGGAIKGSGPISLDLGDGWKAYGHVSTAVERMAGHHHRDLLCVVDEASGAPQVVFEALDSLNPSRVLLIGNPLRPEGKFYDLCRQADEPTNDPALLRKITIPSTESPDIALERSPRGMADQTWLRAMASEYGEASLWWLSHVLAQFPGDSVDALIPRAWLELAARTVHVPRGPRRLAIDLGLGTGGGDRTVLLVRDDNGVIHWEASRAMNLEGAATRAKLLAQRFNIAPLRITWDATGIGADFANRLAAVGLKGCTPYMGAKGGPRVDMANLRTAAAWEAARRLDPRRQVPTAPGSRVLVDQHPFAIPRELMAELRPEIEAHHYSQDSHGAIELEAAVDVKARLRSSPDLAAAYFMSFAFPGL
jgi:hypothetical protein